jgi:hypothetical protein
VTWPWDNYCMGAAGARVRVERWSTTEMKGQFSLAREHFKTSLLARVRDDLLGSRLQRKTGIDPGARRLARGSIHASVFNAALLKV